MYYRVQDRGSLREAEIGSLPPLPEPLLYVRGADQHDGSISLPGFYR